MTCKIEWAKLKRVITLRITKMPIIAAIAISIEMDLNMNEFSPQADNLLDQYPATNILTSHPHPL